jgi:hypothetical protein
MVENSQQSKRHKIAAKSHFAEDFFRSLAYLAAIAARV